MLDQDMSGIYLNYTPADGYPDLANIENIAPRFLMLALILSVFSVPLRAESPDTLIIESGEQRVAMLELFSSQGCSSCPPAERWMSGLVDDRRLWKRVVPLVFHVDYWDYLGWKDPYSAMEYSQRQRRYKLHGHINAVYTPGFVLAGEEWRGWFKRRGLQIPDRKTAGNLRVVLEGDRFLARFVRNADPRNLFLHCAILGFDITTPVKSGENRGRRLKQDFVVLATDRWPLSAGQVKGTLPDSEFEGRLGVAFWVSLGGDPTPLQAAGGWLLSQRERESSR